MTQVLPYPNDNKNLSHPSSGFQDGLMDFVRGDRRKSLAGFEHASGFKAMIITEVEWNDSRQCGTRLLQPESSPDASCDGAS